MNKAKVLIVDDEEYVRKLVTVALESENMQVCQASNGAEALEIINHDFFDLIILDIMMDGLDGYETIAKIRSQGINAPVFFLTGKGEDYDKILGFGIGADAYITKPFSPAVLCAEAKTHIKRYQKLLERRDNSSKIQHGPFILNLKTFTFYKNNQELFLSSKEAFLMKFFMEHPNQVFSKEQLYKNVWNDTVVDDNSIIVYISRLRSKIEDSLDKPRYIQTVWGIGYKFTIED
jgi:Response regulators consisting of a CheY-like receiver domain and a winged-helix DNA-binding domain